MESKLLAETDGQVSLVVEFAQALSDPVRVRILALLLEGGSCCRGDSASMEDGVCVCEIMEHFGLIQSKVSYHLAKLKAVGLVSEEKHGKWNYYTVNRQKIAELLEACSGFLCSRSY